MSWYSLRRDLQGVSTVAPAIACLFFCDAANGATLDSTFNPSVSGTVSSIAVQDDGKVLIGGSFSSVNGTSMTHLARLNADGTLDASFGAGQSQPVYAIKVTGTHIFVGAGDGIRRYTREGALDWHYPMSVKTFTVDLENRVVFGGQFSRIDSQPHRNIARLNANGTIDSAFTAQIGCCAGEGVYALEARGSQILAGGAFQSVNDTMTSHVALLGGDGALATGFAATATPAVLAFASTSNGKFIRVSERTVARHMPDGSLDQSFSPLNAGPDDWFTTAAVHSDGSTIVGGQFNAGGSANVTRLNSSGAVDAAFNLQADGSVHAVAVDAEGFVLIGGAFTTVNGAAQSGIARLALTSDTASSPRLNVTTANGQLTISWPANVGSYVLQARELNAGTWTDVSGAPTVTNDRNYMTQPAEGAGKMYRLRD
jgi:uncharacterized delta-60 repeat protein